MTPDLSKYMGKHEFKGTTSYIDYNYDKNGEELIKRDDYVLELADFGLEHGGKTASLSYKYNKAYPYGGSWNWWKLVGSWTCLDGKTLVIKGVVKGSWGSIDPDNGNEDGGKFEYPNKIFEISLADLDQKKYSGHNVTFS